MRAPRHTRRVSIAARLLASLIAVTATTSSSRTARAERVWSLQGLLEANTGVSDNLNAGPEDPPPDLEVAEADGGLYSSVTPGLLMLYDAPEQAHEVTASMQTIFLVGAEGSESVNGRAGWRGLFTPSPFVSVRTFAQALYSVATDTFLPSFGGDTVVALPTSFSQALVLNASESLSWEFTRGWRLTQYTGGRLFAGFGGGDVVGGADGSVGGGFERVWRRTAIGVTGGITYTDFARPGMTGADDQAVVRGLATLRRDLTERFNVVMSGGAASLVGAQEGADESHPIGDLTASHTILEDGWISASGRRDVRPNLFIAHIVLSNQLTTTMRVPAWWLRDRVTRRAPASLDLNFGVGRQRAVEIADQDMSSPWTVYTGSLIARYSPRENMTFSAGYTYARQDGNPMIGELFLPFSRHLFAVSFTGVFPEKTRVRSRLSRRRFQRVDETNLDVGEDPAGRRR